MKTKMLLKQPLFIACTMAATLLFSCKKADIASPATQDASVASEQLSSFNTAADENNTDNVLFSEVMESDQAAVSSGSPEPTAKVTYSPSKDQYPQTVTKDYGAGITNKFGHTKKGKLIITYSGPIKTAGSVSITIFDNYYIDGKKIRGKQALENVTKPGGPLTYSLLADRQNIYPNGDYSKAISNKINTLTEGASTNTTGDDGYNVVGQTFGTQFTNGNKTTFTATIDNKSPLHQMNTCEFPDAGVVNATVVLNKGGTFRESLDYGAGSCDSDAILTVNKKNYNITLPLTFWPAE